MNKSIIDFSKTDTIFLRCMAILLVINSHLDDYYPLQYLATGGSMGNSLFFVLSSFGLFLSTQKNPKPFTEWYTQRIKRIYPTVWIVILLLTLPYKIHMDAIPLKDFLLVLGYFFYPPFWFLQALMIFYIIMYCIIKNHDVKKLYCLLAVLCMFYTFFYLNFLDLSKWCIEDDPFQYLFYLIVFIFGAYLAAYNDKIKYSGIHDWLLLCLSVAVIYGHKFLMLKGMSYKFQFIEHVFIFPFLFYSFKISRSPLIQKRIMRLPVISRIISYISDMTLELYLVHLYVILFVIKLKLLFPVSIAVVLILTLIISAFVRYLQSLFLRKFVT